MTQLDREKIKAELDQLMFDSADDGAAGWRSSLMRAFDLGLSHGGALMLSQRKPDPRDHERHAGEWHEWSTDTSDEGLGKQPQRMFVRIDSQGVIEVTESYVTSRNAQARELDGGQSLNLTLNGDLALWLVCSLLKALEEKNREPPKEGADVD